MGGARQIPAKPKASAAKKPAQWRIRGWRVRNLAAGGFLLVFFALGFYMAQLYGEISALIEQRRAAMTSAIFSAPFPIVAGDDLDRSGLLDRLAQLSYSQVASANTPGEYTEQELAARLAEFAGFDPLVLICHTPPKNTQLDRAGEGQHYGSTAVREFIEKHQPQHFFGGHIHEAEGVVIQMGITRAQNVGKKGYVLDL